MKNNLNSLVIRALQEADCNLISKAFAKQGWHKPTSQYLHYLTLQKTGERDILVAELNKELAGYLTIQWVSAYLPFKEKNIPEVVDFNVLKKFQRKGIGTALMDEAEKRIKKVSEFAGIGFGLTKDYGAAQILYFNRGYKPDGNGIAKASKTLNYGDMVRVDDNLALYLLKEIQPI